jgi:hypothetical protein
MGMEGAENLLGYGGYRPPGWVVVEATPLGMVIKDPEMSLPRAAITGWKLLLTAAIDGSLVAFTFLVAPPLLVFQAIGWFAASMIPLCFWCIWARWRTPCWVRIGNGKVSLRCQKGSKVSEYDWDVRDISELETSFNNAKFHSNYSLRIHVRDGTKVPFLHCMNGKEGFWLLNYVKMLIANEQGAMMVQEGLAPALEISLPPPPLPAMGARVAAMEQEVVRTVPPGQPDSQSELTSNQNKA